MARVRLGDVLRIRHGFAFPGEHFSEEPHYPTLVTPGNFAIGGGFKPTKPKTFTASYPKEYELHPGDLVISMTDLSRDGATLGLPGVIPVKGAFLHNQRIGLVAITDPGAVDKRYLNYSLRTADYRSYILGTASGSTVRHTSPGRIEAYETDLPGLAEQRAIAAVLGALDDKIAANTKLAETSADFARTLYEGALREVCDEFTLADVATLLTRGVAPKYSDDDDSIIVLNQKCIRGQRVSLEPSRKTIGAKVREDKLLKFNDVLVNSTGQGTLGRVARWTSSIQATADSHISIVRFDPQKVDPTCAGFAVLRMQEVITDMGEGSTGQTELSRSELGKLRVVLPSKHRQAELGKRLTDLNRLESEHLAENLQLTATRDTLLPQLMSGKLRVKDIENTMGEMV